MHGQVPQHLDRRHRNRPAEAAGGGLGPERIENRDELGITNPQERLRIRTKNQEASNRKRLEVYTEIVRLSGLIARERGYDLVERVDRMPESGDSDLTGLIERRVIVHFDPSIDITPAVLEHLNKDYSARKK